MAFADHISRQDWIYRWAGEVDADILDRDAKLTMSQANNRPGYLAIHSAKGSFVTDHSARDYLDLHGNNCHHIGYRHPALISGLIDQLSILPVNTRGFTNEVFVTLAEQLYELWPGNDGRLFMVPGGSAAVELALALTRVHTGRYKTLSFADSFHGRSLGAIGLTAAVMERSERLGSLLPGALHVPSFKPAATPVQASGKDIEAAATISLNAIREVMDKEGDIGCIIAEPIANGGFRPPDWYWPEIRQLCDAHDSLLIFDEIPIGLGKTGVLFNSEHFGVLPDMTVLGKALGGAALPVAAVLADGKLDSARELNLGYFTHEKNPLMARAGLETLGVIRKENLVENAANLGPEISHRIDALRKHHPEGMISHCGEGLIHRIELARDKMAEAIFYNCMENGVILNYSGYGAGLSLSLPLNIAEEHIDLALDVLGNALKHVR